MLAQFGAILATVHSVACKVYRRRLKVAAGVALLAANVAVSGCTAPLALTGQDPADPTVKVAPVGYRSTIAPYSPLRPSTPAPWRERNESVTPRSRGGSHAH